MDNQNSIQNNEPEAPNGAAEQARPQKDISFSGGAANEFVREFAASPRYARTLEEIERGEITPEQQALDEQRRQRVRERALQRQAQQGEAEPQRAPSARAAAPAYTAAPVRPSRNILIDPLSDEDEEAPAQWRISGTSAPAPQKRASQPKRTQPVPMQSADGTLRNPYAPPSPAAAEPAPAEPAAPQKEPSPARAAIESPYTVPLTRFERMFSENRSFGICTLLFGAVNAVWDFLYFYTLISRNVVLGNAERALLLQGQRVYTITFTSPVLTVLNVLVYLLPVLALIWAFLFKKTDNQQYRYNKKTVIVYLCLIVVAVLITVLDLTALHLLG